ncbi:protein-glutamate O-methyltransferase CheR [Pseudomaricurvus alcaniphilus]|uniref:CheR family methyltransferase n=1 Tax=Pseudomaricurvus alcaniphilus TaxID=1166482 RepID=UPI003132FF3D
MTSSTAVCGFDAFRQYLRRVSGIALAENKQYLVEVRLRRIMTDMGLGNLTDLVELLQLPGSRALRGQVVDAMTTNETYWFRDQYPFECLRRTLLPELLARADHTPVRIWSAACSTGQEPFSISIAAQESYHSGADARPVEIVATDLSSRVLGQALAAEYDQLAITRGLDDSQVRDYFQRSDDGASWRLKPHLQERVSFRALNLLDSYASLGQFDLIFCRNVLIYFDSDAKQDILRRLHRALKPNGILFLGASEGVANLTDLFELVHAHPGIYYRAR